jgi:hypothetical protein
VPDQLPADPFVDVDRDVAVLDLVEDDKARAYIAWKYPPALWRDHVVAFLLLGFIPGRDEDGTPICIAGDRDLWFADHRRRRRAEREQREAQRAADPQLARRQDVERDELAAVHARRNAGDVWRRGGRAAPAMCERAFRIAVRSRVGRARLTLGRLLPAPRPREHRARRRRTSARPAPAGEPSEPEPPGGRR